MPAGNQAGDRRRVWALGVFVGAYFLARIQDTGDGAIGLRPQYWELPILAALTLVAAATRQVDAGRALRAAWVAGLVGTVGFFVHGGALGEGTDSDYLYSWMLWTLYFTVAVLVAFVFFDAEVFYRVFWRLGMAATIVAVAGFVLARSGETMALAQYADYGGGLRLTGMLSEPSAWAPVLTALLLMAVRDRRWLSGAVVVLAILLSRSPTVLITLSAALALLVLLRPGRVYLKMAALAASLALAPTVLAVFGDPRRAELMQASGNPLSILLGRVLSGLQYIESGGQLGANDRFEGARDVWAEVTSNGWLWTGRGLGSSDVYFTTVLGDFRAYSLPLTILFDLGLLALLLYVALAARAIWRLRAGPMGLVLIPFILASTINSAQGVQFYKFAVVAVLVYGVGRRRSRGAVADGEAERGATAAPVRRRQPA